MGFVSNIIDGVKSISSTVGKVERELIRCPAEGRALASLRGSRRTKKLKNGKVKITFLFFYFLSNNA